MKQVTLTLAAGQSCSNRVWGLRTMSADPECKYVNVLRLFIYRGPSIDKSTQWAVLEPTNENLWASICPTSSRTHLPSRVRHLPCIGQWTGDATQS
jgi:phage tail sheath protein FI